MRSFLIIYDLYISTRMIHVSQEEFVVVKVEDAWCYLLFSFFLWKPSFLFFEDQFSKMSHFLLSRLCPIFARLSSRSLLLFLVL